MEKLIVLLIALAMIILGARGTYKAVWNQFFPNEQITTTPASTQGPSITLAPPGTVGNQTSSMPTQQQVTTQSGQKVNLITGGGGVYPVETVGRTQSTVISTGIPSWWPSWLPWPGNLIGYYPGAGQTGQTINTPGVP